MLKRLLRWLARQDIENAYCAGLNQGQAWQEEACKIAYAKGQLDGNHSAFNAVEQSARERNGIDIEAADCERGRKGLLH